MQESDIVSICLFPFCFMWQYLLKRDSETQNSFLRVVYMHLDIERFYKLFFKTMNDSIVITGFTHTTIRIDHFVV